MKTFAERNPVVVGAVGVAITVCAVVVALNYGRLPFVNSNREYSAYFAEAGGLLAGAAVQVSGFKAGEVTSIDLDGAACSGHLRGRQEHPPRQPNRGSDQDEKHPRRQGPRTDPQRRRQTIRPHPPDRTTSPYQLPDALGDLTAAISQLDTTRLSDSWKVMADEFSQTPPALKIALQGVATLRADAE